MNDKGYTLMETLVGVAIALMATFLIVSASMGYSRVSRITATIENQSSFLTLDRLILTDLLSGDIEETEDGFMIGDVEYIVNDKVMRNGDFVTDGVEYSFKNDLYIKTEINNKELIRKY